MVSPELLRRYPFFAGLTREQLLSLTWIAHIEIYEKGDKLFCQDEPATRLYLLVDGQVIVFIEFDHELETITNIEQGGIFGWSAMVAPFVRTGTAQCTVASEVIGFEAEALRRLMAADGQLGCLLMGRVAQVVAARLRDAYVHLASLTPVYHAAEQPSMISWS